MTQGVFLESFFFYFDKFSKRGKYWKYLYFIKIVVAKEKEKLVTIRIQGREILSFQLSLLAVKQRLKYFYVFSSLLLLSPKLSGNWTGSKYYSCCSRFQYEQELLWHLSSFHHHYHGNQSLSRTVSLS